MRACLPRSRNNGSITAPPPPDRLHHLLTSRNSPPFSLSPAHSFFVLLSFFLSLFPYNPLFVARRVPFLLSRFSRPPSFLYTMSFAVVGEGETPAFAVGEAVLFFPLIKADRCGSGCRDDGTGRRVAAGGIRRGGRVARCARRQRRWAEVVGRRWRRARHSMTCHVPTLPLTHPCPSRVSTPLPPSPTPGRAPQPSSLPSPSSGCVCVYGKYSRASAL